MLLGSISDFIFYVGVSLWLSERLIIRDSCVQLTRESRYLTYLLASEDGKTEKRVFDEHNEKSLSRN